MFADEIFSERHTERLVGLIRRSTSQTLMVKVKVSRAAVDSRSEPASQDRIVKTGKCVPLQNLISKRSHNHF